MKIQPTFFATSLSILILVCACDKPAEPWHGRYLSKNPVELAGGRSGTPEWNQLNSLRTEVHLAPDGTATIRGAGNVVKMHYRRRGNTIQIGPENQYIEYELDNGVLKQAGIVVLFKQ